MFINGVTIVLSGAEGEVEGMAVSWVTQVESEYLIISVPKKAKATNSLLINKTFSVSILSQDQENIAKKYGGNKCKESSDSSNGAVKFLQNGMPVIANSCATIICQIFSTNEIAEQIMIVGKIEEVVAMPGCKPLIYDKSNYFE